MRVLFFATRLAGTDGVSLEAAKMREALERQGHEVWLCAGELEPDEPRGVRVAEMHFADPVATELGERAFAGEGPDPALEAAIDERARWLAAHLDEAVAAVRPELAVVQNAWAIPMQLPLAVALAKLVERTGLPTLAHHHDYWWERQRFARHRIGDLLARYFPFDSARVVHLSINSPAQAALLERRDIASLLLPNVLDFDQPPPRIDERNAGFRKAIGIEQARPLLLQPTRVVPRKGIELAIDLCSRLADLRPALVITHEATDEGPAYLESLRELARARAVRMCHVPELIGPKPSAAGSDGPRYALWDAYAHADLVTYPSRYEGFGNALLEAVWCRKPLLVRRYPVYASDIAPAGFRFVEIDEALDERAAAKVRELLPQASPDAADRLREITEDNARVAAQHFGYPRLARVLDEALGGLGGVRP